MKKIYNILAACVIGLTLTSCDDFLDYNLLPSSMKIRPLPILKAWLPRHTPCLATAGIHIRSTCSLMEI